MSPARNQAPDPELVGRFKAALDRLNPGGGNIGLAVSGGPDSMAMLLLAHAAIPGRFEVATVNHGLRAEAGDECALVAGVCAERGIACAVLEVTVAAGNVQAKAREARYAALADWLEQRDMDWVATAHHADDQAETLLMRLNRASGLAGLAGIREFSHLLPPDPESGWLRNLYIMRPLLEFRRSELRQVVELAGLAVVTDPSNEDESFDRVRIRKALATADWLDPIALTKSAAHLADANAALDDFALYTWAKYVREHEHGFTYYPHAPGVITLRIIARIIEELGGTARGGEVATMLERLERDEQASLGGVLASRLRNMWYFRPEPPRRTG